MKTHVHARITRFFFKQVFLSAAKFIFTSFIEYYNLQCILVNFLLIVWGIELFKKIFTKYEYTYIHAPCLMNILVDTDLDEIRTTHDS